MYNNDDDDDDLKQFLKTREREREENVEEKHFQKTRSLVTIENDHICV